MVYYPYKAEKYAIPFTIGMSIFCLVFAGHYLYPFKYEFFIPFLVGVFGIVLSKILYDQAKIAIFFEADGIRILNEKTTEHCFISWEKLSYGYSGRTYKGYQLLILSPHQIDKKEIIKKYNISSFLLRNNVLVIPCNFPKERKVIVQLLKEKKIDFNDNLSF